MTQHITSPSASEPERATLVWTTSATGPARLIIDEWERLVYSRPMLRRVNAWPFMTQRVESLDEVLVLAGFGKPIDDNDGDHMLWQLVRHAEHDELAARIVLHRVMPSILAMVRRRGRVVPGGMSAAMNEAIGAAWMVIRQFPHHRRHHKIAANLVRDIEYHAFVREYRLKRVEETQVGNDMMSRVAHNPQIDPLAERLNEVLCDALESGVATEHIALLERLAAGETTDQLADEVGLSTRTMRNRRRSAIDAVRLSMQWDAAQSQTISHYEH
jgi:hypothetical protein